MNSMAWCPSARHSPSASVSFPLNTLWLPIRNSPRMSTTSTAGRGRWFTRWRSSMSCSRFSGRTPGMARMYVEMEGVALPITSTAPWAAARCQATSRAS